MKAIITVGVPSSGKTTWAEEFMKMYDRESSGTWINVNRDDLRREIFGLKKNYEYKFTRHKEAEVTKKQQEIIENAAEKGRNVIVSDTNLNEGRRKELIHFLSSLGYEVELKDFPIDLMEAVKRDLKRDESVGFHVIYGMYQNWLKYAGRKQYEPDLSKPKAYIVDIDGTLAQMTDRGPFDWDKVDQDLPVGEVAWVTDSIYDNNFTDIKVILMSGRDGSCRELTEEWLTDELINYDELYIREAGDMRKDSTVKEEIFWDQIADRYHVLGVFDDRPQVCRMWRELGLKVFNVGDPYKEF